MAKSVPSYLKTLALEGAGDPDAVRNELALCQIEAMEAQTQVLSRIAAAMEGPATLPEAHQRLVEACEKALTMCQDGDATAAAHALHSALGEVLEDDMLDAQHSDLGAMPGTRTLARGGDAAEPTTRVHDDS